MTNFKINIIILLLLIPVVWFSGCEVSSPKAPSWTTPLNIPLSDSTFTVTDLVDSEEDIYVNDNGQLNFRFEGKSDTTRVGSFWSLTNAGGIFNIGLNELSIPELAAPASRFPFGQLYPSALQQDGGSYPVDSFSVTGVEGQMFILPDFQSIHVRSGTGVIHLVNRLPVPLTQLQCVLRSTETGSEILRSPVVARLEPNDSTAVEVDLDDIVIIRASQWVLNAESPGSGGQVVPIDATQPFDLFFELTSIRIHYLRATLPAVDIDYTDTLSFEQPYPLTEVGTRNGFLKINVINHLPVGFSGVLSTDHIRTRNSNAPLVVEIDLDANGNEWIQLDLTDRVVEFDALNGEKQPISFHIEGTTEETASGPVEIESQTALEVIASLEEVRFDYLEGLFNRESLSLTKTEVDIDLDRWGDLNGVVPQDGRLRIIMHSTLELPFYLQGQLTGSNEEGASASVSIDERIPEAQDGQERVHSLTPLTPQNSTLLDVLRVGPSRLAFDGNVLVGDGLTTRRIRFEDRVWAEWVMDMPAFARFPKRLVRLDTTHLRILPESKDPDDSSKADVELESELTNHLDEARFTLRIANGLPIGGNVRVLFASARERLDTNPELIVGPIQLDAASSNSAGQAVSQNEQERRITLDTEDLTLFRNNGMVSKDLYMATEMAVDSTQKAVQIWGEDAIRIQSLLTLQVNVDDTL
jgi:hypothetical protein